MRIRKTVHDWQLTERVWFNALWFQLTWFICVLGRETWLVAGIAMLVLHFLLCRAPLREAKHLAPIALVGIAVDAALSLGGVFDFGSGVVVPLWLAVLWVAFATTLSRSLAVLGRQRWVAALVGGLGVPFNYGVGARFGAVDLPLPPVTTAVILVALWALLLPVLYVLAAPKTTSQGALSP